MTDIARESALNLLHQLDRKQLTLDTVMNDFTAAASRLDKRDMALVQALVYGVVRWRLHLDHIIAHFSKTPLEQISPEILNVLRMGVFQLKFMDKIPESAAVNTSVELAKYGEAGKKKTPVWVVKYVNGMLRNVARNLANVPFPDENSNKTLSIAVRHSFPTWLVQRWLNRFGDEETHRLCEKLNRIPEITVRTNTLKTDRTSLAQSLSPFAKDVNDCVYAPFGISFNRPSIPIHLLEPFREGWFQVQDEGAQLVSEILDPQPSERILDACAGLGGKTGHLAQLMTNRGEIIAVDHDEKKLRALDLDMRRLGVTIVKTAIVNLDESLATESLGLFDRVLVDAPCSGMGVLRRNPDGKWNMTKKNLNRFSKRQVRFLSAVSGLLKPGGILVYAVCSTEPEENEGVIESFLHRHPDFAVERTSPPRNEKIESLRNAKGHYVSFPHIHNMDGFFITRLKRQDLLS